MKAPVQIVFVLDVDKEVPIEEVRALLSSHRERIHVLKLSEFGAPSVKRSGDDKSPVDWAGLAEAVVRMVTKAREYAKGTEVTVEYYIAGHAPLPVFAHVGAELSAWDSVTVINRRKDSTWTAVPLTRTDHTPTKPFFDIVPGPPRRSDLGTDGRIAVFISCGKPPHPEKMGALIREQGESVGQMLEICTSSDLDLNESNGVAAALQLNELLGSLQSLYSHSSGLAIFIAGPAQLAVMVGRALNPTIHVDAWIANFDAGTYELAYALPWRGSPRLELSQTAEARLLRSQILAELNASLADFREQFDEADLPPTFFPMGSRDKERFIDIVKRLKPLRERNNNDEPFQYDALEDTLVVSPGLLEAMALLEEPQRVALGKIFILHELFHVSQDLRSDYYHGIGRAGFALEEVDYWADAFALGVLATMQVRNRGADGMRKVTSILTALTSAVLKGLATFDRFFEQKNRIERLQERRARRYLIWHLQHARAETITHSDHIWQLLGSRLVVELAPLEGGVNAGFDKIAHKTVDRTELFIVLKAKLMREPKSQSFDPDRILQAIRELDIDTVQRYMRVVRTKHEGILVPWRLNPSTTRAE